MESWFFVRGYRNNTKFTSKNRNTIRGRSLKAIPFVINYHLNLKSMNKVILKYLDLLYMQKKVKTIFTPKPVISFRSARKQSRYLVRAKIYSTKRTEGSCRCGGKRCEVCINVNETSPLTSAVTGETYIINHSFDCNERCLVYLLTCNKCKMQWVCWVKYWPIPVKMEQLQKWL